MCYHALFLVLNSVAVNKYHRQCKKYHCYLFFSSFATVKLINNQINLSTETEICTFYLFQILNIFRMMMLMSTLQQKMSLTLVMIMMKCLTVI